VQQNKNKKIKKSSAIRAVSGSPNSSQNEILLMLSGAEGASILLTYADVPPYADGC
jgi:hypothetical protein